jgi:hypothetical protein
VQLPLYPSKLNYQQAVSKLRSSANELNRLHILFLALFIPLFLSIIFLELFVKPVDTAQKVEVLGVKTANPTVKRNPKFSTPAPAATVTPSATPTPNPTQQLTRSIYLGMWTEGMWDDPALKINPSKLTELQSKISKKVAIAHFYTGWSNLTNGTLLTQLQVVKNNGWRPMVSANPYFFDRCVSSGGNIYKTIASGNCDSFLVDASKQLKSYGSPIFLRFAWEMNIDSMEWSIQKTGSTPTEYIQSWRRFHDIAVREGASNVLWVFSPNIITPTSISYSALYPGNDYVDWTGLDGYNWGKTQSWSNWESFSTVFKSSYNSLLSIAPSKPIMIAEVNTTDIGGDKPAWYQDMLSVQLINNFPQIKAVVFYNENRSAKEGVNWLIDISPLSLEAFSQAIQNPVYLSNF